MNFPLLAPSFIAIASASISCLAASAPASAAAAAPTIIEWECGDRSSGRLDEARLAEIEAHVRDGGGLLVAIGRNPGTDAFRFARLAPTTAWHTLMPAASRGSALPPATSDPDSRDALFFAQPLPVIRVPWRWDIRPLHAVERGIARYERFEQKAAPYTREPVPAGTPLWTRPLENRDWRVRLRTSATDDPYQNPLLLTGRFGAGRVVVWASSLDSLKTSHVALNAVRQWLGGATPPPLPPPSPSTTLPSSATPDLTGDIVADAENRVVRLTLRNPRAVAVRGEAVARFLTWEGALVGDALAAVELPAGGETTITLPFPAGANDAATGYATLAERDEWTVRVGVVGEDGRLIFPERRVAADLRPPVRVELAADSLRTLDNKNYPYASIGPDTLFYPARMGAQTSRYAWKPGDTVNLTATLQHSLTNIAPQAAPRDETTPDNASVSGLNDGAIHNEKGPRAGVIAWNAWKGVAKEENRVTLTLPRPREIRALALHLQPDAHRFLDDQNPASVRIEIDGREVARADDLDTRAVATRGRVLLALPPGERGGEVRLVFPWTSPRTPRGRERRAPVVGEVELLALADPAPAAPPATPAGGELVIRALDHLSGDTRELSRTTLTLAPGEQRDISAQFKLPDDDARGEQFWQIEALWRGQTASTFPVLATSGERALASIEILRPKNAIRISFIVTRGFRSVFDTGTGTHETPGSWSSPDDLVWAYARKLKQTGARTRAPAGALYVNDTDFRHYCNPWISFPNGENFYEVAIPHLLARAKADRRWAEADRVILDQGDRWDTGPSMDAMFNWTNFIEFDAYLRARGLPGLKGRTRLQLSSEILSGYNHRWQAFHLDRYLVTLRQLRSTFAAAGKAVYITAQGIPLVPTRAEADAAAVIQGMSDDSTWGMNKESVPWTTGRQLGHLAINPSWRMNTLLNWGWNSAAINNWHWYCPVGTDEPSRRHYYHRAWRGILDPVEGYRAMHTFGFGSNGYASWTMTPHDWQGWWRLHERHALLTPDAPLGPGIVRSTTTFDAPETALFGGGGMGGDAALSEVARTATLFQRLHEAGLAPAFAANAAQIDRWPDDTSMVILNPAEFSTSETAALARWLKAGGRAVAFHNPASGSLPPDMAALFPQHGSEPQRDGGPQRDGQLRGNTLLVPVDAGKSTPADFATRLASLRATLAPPLEFPPGILGYGFRRGALRFAVVEDWGERARTVELRIHNSTPGATIRAVALNDHRPLAVRNDTGGDWLVTVPVRPGDGEVVVWREMKNEE
ncbi:MAG: hypothetical protein LBK99_27070 [Opitutaceae bacterium]|jgi:hypothetical protein|nr:hypothetical protein [Opitutaceae bacterium]